MKDSDFDNFVAMLDAAYDLLGNGQGKTLSPGAKGMFFAALSEYSLEQVRAGLSTHCKDERRGQFAPKPADVIFQIKGRVAGADGRPGAEEAWAIALASHDEAETVVWTEEIAQAMAICRQVLVASGPITARMTFLQAYERLVGEARANAVAVRWNASLGHDPDRRKLVLQAAVRLGQLPAPTVAGLLPPPAPDQGDNNAREQLKKIRAMMEEGQKKAHENREQEAQRKRDREIELKKISAEKVRQTMLTRQQAHQVSA